MAVKYTTDQQKVIDTRDCNILVSAAAGSGKTAVLTERIIQRICDSEHPVQIDRMLIVTFTNAAAAEMRERIGNALRKRLESDPENAHLRKQITLLNNAQITTIDSFCLYLLRNHFHEIGLEPGFRIGDDGEIKLLQQEVLEEYLEQKYETAEESFLDLVEKYAGTGKDDALKDLILRLHLFSESHPFPEDFITQCMAELQDECGGLTQACETFLYEYEQELLEECVDASNEAIALCRMPGGPVNYEEAFSDDLHFYQCVKEAKGFTERAAVYRAHKFKTLSRSKVADLDETIKEEVKNIRDKKCKKIIEEIKKNIYYGSAEDILEDNRRAGKTVAALLALVLEFAELFEHKKREKNIIDFSDMEHLALRILLRKEGDLYVPSEVARGYQDYFEEIMVDEYQDSNQVQECLLESISRQSEEYGNRFMVGDVKQSIYRFRLARPEIFMEKYGAFHPTDGKNRRINLSMNFRSRKEVLDGVNAVFEQLMIPAVGKVSYDADARLYYGAAFPESESNCNTELLLYNKSEFSELNISGTEAEARIMATHIKKLCEEFLVTDKETGHLRPAVFSDMVILLRAASGVDDIIKKTLEKEGIPTYVASGKGYFAATEIKEILNFMTVLNNPRQDIPLLGVLHSVFGGFEEAEIARIRVSNGKKGRLYDSLVQYAGNGKDCALRSKAEAFLKMIEGWREEAVYHSVYELLEKIMSQTGFLHYCTALPGGEQRRANLMVFLQKAKAFESSGYSGLFDFIRYMEQMQEREVDFGEANILDEKANVVRIMTIHKSKGLEFPICFVAGFGRQFNMRDASDAVLTDAELGMGGDSIDLALRCRRKSLRKNVIALKQKKDSRGEDLRVLYVAMTRAKEKLILVGHGALSETVRDGLSAYDILKAKSFMEMVLPIAAKHAELFEITEYTPEDISLEKVTETIEAHIMRESLKGLTSDAVWKPYEYPHPSLEGLYTKTTVSELKKAAYLEEAEPCQELYKEEEFTEYVPAFIAGKEETITGGRRGSAYHRIMELMDFTIALKEGNIEEDIRAARKKAIEELRISEADANLVSEKKVWAFMKTELARRMGRAQTAGLFYPEQPFMMRVKANSVKEDFPEEEDILVQGVIDVYFQEDDALVLMDYKTDRVSEAEELIKRYRTQLDYYAEALERLTHKKVKEKLIYSFALEEVITVDE